MAPGALNHEYRNQSDLFASILGKSGSQSISYTSFFVARLGVLHDWNKLLFMLIVSGLVFVPMVDYFRKKRIENGPKKNEYFARLAEQRKLKEFFVSTEFGPTYMLPSLTTRVLQGLAALFLTIGIPLLGFGIQLFGLAGAASFIPFFLAGTLFYFSKKAVKNHVRIEDGIFFRFASGRKIIEFDLRYLEEWSLEVITDTDNDRFSSATLRLKSRFSKKPLRISTNDNNTLFIDMLTMLHKDKRDLALTDPALLEPEFPESETEIRQLLKNW